MLKVFEIMKIGSIEDVRESCRLLGIDSLSDSDAQFILDEVTKYVFDTKNNKSGKKTFDLNLDYKYYFVDFLRLGINLNKDDISWWEFDAILEGIFLDENSTLSKMMSYRLYEKPPKNPKQQELNENKFRMKMKAKYALSNEEVSNDALGKLWTYLEKKAGDSKE